MDNFKLKNNEMPIRVYKPSGWSQFGIWLFIVLVLVHFSFIMRVSSEMGWWMLVFIPFYALILWTLFLSSGQRHLAIYEHGLEYRYGNNVSFSRWEDLKHFEFRASGKTSIVGISTSHLEKRQQANGFERFFLSGYDDFIPLSLVRVPTRWDGCWTGSVVDTTKLAETEFGAELLHYAPHLFKYAKEKAKNG